MSAAVVSLSFNDVDFSSCNSLKKILKNRQVASRVAEEEWIYYPSATSKAVSSLAELSDLLEMVYTKSKGFQCSEGIKNILASYQTMVKRIVVTTSRFFDASLLALQKHQIAFKCLNERNYTKALENITKCAEAVAYMTQMSTTLIAEADSLINRFDESLTAAAADFSMAQTRLEERRNKNQIFSWMDFLGRDDTDNCRRCDFIVETLGWASKHIRDTRLFWMGQRVFLALPCLVIAV
jgi:hypothetical protein